MNSKKLVFGASLFLCFFSLALTLYLGYQYKEQHSSEKIELRAKKLALEKAKRAITEIKTEFPKQKFERIKGVVDTIANKLNKSDLPEEQLKKLLKEYINKKDLHLKQIGATYSPYAHNAKKRLYSPGYTRDKQGKLIFENVIYDYTLPDSPDLRTAWYHLPMENGAGWLEPYWGTGAQDYLAEYSAPFSGIHAKTKKHERLGIIYANFSLENVHKKVDQLDLGRTGYGFIITQDNNIVSHPIKYYMEATLDTLDDKVLKTVVTSATKTGLNYTSKETGQSYWLFYLPIEKTDWNLGLVLNAKDFKPSSQEKRQDLIAILISCLSFLFFLILVMLRVDLGASHSLIKFSSAISILCFIGLLAVWNISISANDDEQFLNYDNQDEKQYAGDIVPNIKVFEAAEAHTALSKCINSNPSITAVPTGVFIQSLHFTSANNVIMTGYVWQKVSSKPQANSSPTIILPEAEDVSIEPAFEKKEGGNYLIGWYFKATLRQQFDDHKYPFDREDVWLRLWSSDLNRNVILTPDFDAYDVINPSTIPGVEKQFVLEGWDIENSFFSYRDIPYNTTFGYLEHGAKNSCPELYFNIGVKRKFLSPFISDLLPLFVISILLFGVLLIASKNEQKINLFGYSTSEVLGYGAALFFVLIVSHVHLRQSVAAHSIIYLEYFYFVMYAAILLVSANSILFVSNSKLHVIQYKDNFLVKVFYWPVLMVALLVISLFVFY